MPLYEYRCSDCGRKFEELVSSTREELLPECPYCRSQNTEKQFSRFAATTGNKAHVPACGMKGSCGGGGGGFS